MKITSEDVKAVQNRVDVTYEEAERFLIKAHGDIEQAIFLIGQKKESSFSKLMDEGNRLFKELLTYYIKIQHKDEILVNLPLIILIIFLVFINLDTKIWVLVLGMGAILISESQVMIYRKVKKSNQKNEMITDTDKGSTMDTNTKNQENPDADENIEEGEMVESPSTSNVKTNDDDDYFEITIEK